MEKKTNAKIKLGDSIGMFGGTGTGKTTASLEIVKGFYLQSEGKIPIYILDSKLSGDFKELTKPGIGKHYFGDAFPPLENKPGEGAFIVWTPTTDDFELYDAWFQLIYLNARHTSKPSFIYIDELSSISTRGGSTPRYYDTIVKQGRGMGITVLSLTQVARYVSLAMASQLTHAFVFNMNNDKDKQKMKDNFGLSKNYRIPDQHGFYYRDLKKPVSQNPPVYFSSYKNFFK